MAQVRIYRPAKTAMQSGRANTREWVLEFEPTAPHLREPLMGWVSSPDTQHQLHLRFHTKEAAIAYAERHHLTYTVHEPPPARPRPRSYADNFRYDKVV